MQVSLKSAFILLLFFCFFSELKSQDSLYLRYNTFGAELQVGLPFHDFKPLRESRDADIKKMQFPAKVTNDYPYIPYIQGEFLYLIKYFEFGILLSYATTGSGVHYADYSGEYKFEDFLSNYEYGFVIKSRSANEDVPFKTQFWTELGFSSLSYRTKEYLRIYDRTYIYSTNKITNTKNYAEIGLRANYYYKGFYFNGGISYFYEFPSDFYLLIEEPYNLDFGFKGIRAHLGVGYKL